MLKYIWREKKNLIILITVIVICSVAIALGVYAQVTNAKLSTSKEQQKEKDYTTLKNNFNAIFTNSINRQSTAKTDKSDEELIYLSKDVAQKESGSYDINIKIPLFKIETDTTKQINQEIKQTFLAKAIDIVKNSKTNSIYSVDYVAYINENVLSLVIRATLKEGSNPQRVMFQTYNYNLDEDKLATVQDVLSLKNLDSNTVQKKITNEIEAISKQKENMQTQGYNVYKRDQTDKMYKLENTNTFFIGQDGYLYIIYAYGNTNYTSEMDIIIF